MDCIKENQINKSKKGAKRSTYVLEIIYSDVCCPDMDVYGPKYFIDDYSRYMYIYLLHNKNETLGAFKVFKVELEKQ